MKKRTLKQRGYVLYELIIALGIIGVMSAWLFTQQQDNLDKVQVANTATHFSDYLAASTNYINANSQALLTSTGGVGGVTYVTTAQLIAAGNLPTTFSTTNPFGQSYVLLVSQPIANRLEGNPITFGGTPIPESNLQAAAALALRGGGFISNVAPYNSTLLTGAYGAWSVPRARYASLNAVLPGVVGASYIPTTTSTTGYLAGSTSYSGSAATTNWLARVNLGDPLYNTMTTDLLVAGGSNLRLGSTGSVGASNLIFNQNGGGGTVQLNESDVTGGRMITTRDVTMTASSRRLANAIQTTFRVAPGATVAKPNCALGGTIAALTPRVDVAIASVFDTSGRIIYAQEAYETDIGASWTISLDILVPTGVPAAPYTWVSADANSRITVTTKCN